jgi:hypothetical protein
MCMCERKGRVARTVVIVLPRAAPIKVTCGTRVRGAFVAVTPGVGQEGPDLTTRATTGRDLVRAGDRYEETDLR